MNEILQMVESFAVNKMDEDGCLIADEYISCEKEEYYLLKNTYTLCGADHRLDSLTNRWKFIEINAEWLEEYFKEVDVNEIKLVVNGSGRTIYELAKENFYYL